MYKFLPIDTTAKQKRAIMSWALFDWANSSYSINILTFIFASYFVKAVAVNKISGTVYWGNTIAISTFIIALLAPLIGAITDNSGRRKLGLAVTYIVLIIFTALLWFIKPHESYQLSAVIFIGISLISLEIGNVFYNAMLRDIAPATHVGRISGWGWSIGYFGGIVSLTIMLFGFIQNHFGLFHGTEDSMRNVRIVGPFVAAWLIIFGWPIFIFVKDRPFNIQTGYLTAIRNGYTALLTTLRSLKHYKQLGIFLLARLLYTDGLNTVFSFGGIYAAGTFGMSFDNVIKFGISMNIVAGLGAACFAWMDDYVGSKQTILTALVIIIFAGFGIILAHSITTFWILSLVLSLCVGPVQSASRSLMIRIVPAQKITEMFGLYSFSGKITAFLNPWILAILTEAFQSQRAGIASIVVFLIAGAGVLITLKIKNSD